MVKRRTYDRAFKEKAIEMSYVRGNAREIEKELNISLSLLSKWRQQYEKFGIKNFCGQGNGFIRLNPEQQKIIELERIAKLSAVKYEILKEGSKVFSQDRIMVLNFIKKNEKKYSTKKMCRILGVLDSKFHNL